MGAVFRRLASLPDKLRGKVSLTPGLLWILDSSASRVKGAQVGQDSDLMLRLGLMKQLI